MYRNTHAEHSEAKVENTGTSTKELSKDLMQILSTKDLSESTISMQTNDHLTTVTSTTLPTINQIWSSTSLTTLSTHIDTTLDNVNYHSTKSNFIDPNTIKSTPKKYSYYIAKFYVPTKSYIFANKYSKTTTPYYFKNSYFDYDNAGKNWLKYYELNTFKNDFDDFYDETY